MIFLMTIVAMLLLSVCIADRYKVSVGDGIALSGAVTILILYVLAFFRGMKLIGVIGFVFVVVVLICKFITVGKKEVDKFALEGSFCGFELKNHMLDPLFIMFVAAVTVVTLLTEQQVFSWWDDINFWSSDAKQLFYMNGFPGKYGNVSPEFGDYPPVTSIFKWLFLQISSDSYNESLQFAGYFALNMTFLMPLAGRLKKWTEDGCACRGAKKAAFLLVCFAAVVLLPGVFNGIIYYGTPADITMGIVYGALLLAIFEQEMVDENFYYIRIALYSAVLFLTKSVGVEWAIFAFLYYLMTRKKSWKILVSCAVSGGFYISWLLFCLINRRVAKLTGAGLRMATSGTYTAPQNTMEKARYFIEGFWTMPMHADSNITFDISTGLAVMALAAFLFVLMKSGIFEKKEAKKIAIFLGISGLLCYGIIFLAHISIFQTEDQYLDAYAMAVSIARYACPFALGGSYLLIGAFCDRSGKIPQKSGMRIGIAFLLFVLLTADYTGVYKHLLGYRKSVEENINYCYDMVGDEGRILVDKVAQNESLWGKRVLVMRDGHTYTWVHDTYISKEASPVALVYDGYLAEQESSADMAGKMLTSHASYLYVEDADGMAADLFSPLMKEGEEFTPCTVYKIEISEEGVVLTSI